MASRNTIREKEGTHHMRRAVGACLLSVAVIPLLAAIAASGGSPALAATRANFWFMRLFRDVARARARRRRFGQRHALMPLFLGNEEFLPLGDASAGLALTPEELAEFDGRPLPESDERAALLLAIRGRIYDVSAGWSFYGPGKSYHRLVGKDATRAFCTGCLEPACLIPFTAGLAPDQLREADRWIELYEHHDKYKLVGELRELGTRLALGDEVDDFEAAEAADMAAAWERERVEQAQAAESGKKHRPFRPR